MSQSTASATPIITRPCQQCPDPSDPGAFWLDVRSPAEFEALHIPGSSLLPLDQLDPESVRRQAGERPVHLLCRSGNRAAQAAAKLADAGLSGLIVVEGGVEAWNQAGRPVNRGQSGGMSLERQVRVAAGALVLTGVVTGFLIHPALFGLAGFVGAGLVFAGLTDWCGMGLLLAKAPWNRRAGQAASCALIKG